MYDKAKAFLDNHIDSATDMKEMEEKFKRSEEHTSELQSRLSESRLPAWGC